ncbi:hypothetical protein K2Y11_21300 [bacterium]|nr:hypothetical protein [bacterium]
MTVAASRIPDHAMRITLRQMDTFGESRMSFPVSGQFCFLASGTPLGNVKSRWFVTVVGPSFEAESRYITGDLTSKLRLKRPIEIRITQDDDLDSYLAQVPGTKLVASGQTKSEAVENLQDTLVSDFEILSNMPDSSLGKSMIEKKRSVLNLISYIH